MTMANADQQSGILEYLRIIKYPYLEFLFFSSLEYSLNDTKVPSNNIVKKIGG